MKEGKPIPEHKMLKLQTLDNLFPSLRHIRLTFISQKLIVTTKAIMSSKNPSERVSFEWSDPMILLVHTVRSLIELYRHPISSFGRAPVCQVGGRGFRQRPDQQPGSLKNW